MKKEIDFFLKNKISIHINVSPKNKSKLLDFLSSVKTISFEIIKYDKKISNIEFIICDKLLEQNTFVLLTKDNTYYNIDNAILDKLPTLYFK